MKNRFLLSLNLILVAIAGILVSCAATIATTMEAGTRATLRPELSKDDSEVWHISSKGNDITDVEYNAIIRAAYTSRREGKDCFIILDSKTDERKRYFEIKRTKQLTGHTSSNYYGDYGSHVRGSHTTTYEVPTTDSISVGTDRTANMYVIFLSQNSCEAKKETKWRNNIYYNNSVIEHYKQRTRNDAEDYKRGPLSNVGTIK